jgi:methyl-accepting chemotaxis protein
MQEWSWRESDTMNIFRAFTNMSAISSVLSSSRNRWSPDRAHLNAFLRNQLLLEIDLSGTITSCSDALQSILGNSHGEIVGKKIGSFVDPKTAAGQEFSGLWNAVLLGETKQTDMLLSRREAKPLWMAIQFSPVLDAQNKVCKVLAILTNNSETKALALENEDLRVCAEIINMTSIVSEADLKGDIVTVNDKFIEVSKYSREELIGHPHNTTRHPDMPKEVFKELWSTIGRGRPFRGVIKNRAKDGTPYYVDAVIAPVMGENGKPKKYIGVRYDITATEIERQNAKGILDAIDSAFSYVEFDTEGNILVANPTFLQLMGYASDEVVGHHHRMFVDSHTASSSEYRQFWKELAGGATKSETSKRIKKDGKEVFVQSVLAPVKDEMGRVFKIVKIATDVTAEKIKSTDFEEQLKGINRAQGVIEFNLDGSIRTANAVFLEATGYSLEELRGMNHRDLVERHYAESSEYRSLWENLRAGKFFMSEIKRVGKGGRELYLQAVYSPNCDINGKVYKVVKFATDITANKVKEREFAQAQEAASRDAELRRQREQLEAADLQEKVAKVLDVVNAIAEGNFDVAIPVLGEDAIGQVALALQQAVGAMKSALGEVRDVAGTVSAAAEQLTSASREITVGAQTQATSLEETASSLEEITSTVKQNSDNAQQARQLANGSRDIAERGGVVVNDAVQAMSEINNASKKIADIITTIDEIAFQTNLLALNAAVEAARAGEQGRGFAVVAAEVRNLAQRSASAAKEIKTLIQDSVRKVDNGTELVNKSGQTLAEIVNSVKRVTDIVSEIAAASKEQLTGIEQVNKAVTQMDRVTQGNATQTEEMSGTADSLLNHAIQLSELVGRFRLESERATTSATTKARSIPKSNVPPPKPRTPIIPMGSMDRCASEATFEF